MKRKLFFLICAGALAAAAQPNATSYDLVVYGGTASGVMTAVYGARAGLKVALLEPGRHVGGMVSGAFPTPMSGGGK